jgi:hypothetical protein
MLPMDDAGVKEDHKTHQLINEVSLCKHMCNIYVCIYIYIYIYIYYIYIYIQRERENQLKNIFNLPTDHAQTMSLSADAQGLHGAALWEAQTRDQHTTTAEAGAVRVQTPAMLGRLLRWVQKHWLVAAHGGKTWSWHRAIRDSCGQ